MLNSRRASGEGREAANMNAKEGTACRPTEPRFQETHIRASQPLGKGAGAATLEGGWANKGKSG